MLKLDKKDKLMIYELSRNARQSHTQLGKKVRLSKSNIRYRIDRLKKLGVIERFTAVINLGLTGADTAVVLLRFNEHVGDEIKDYFREHKNVDWAITLSGQWDLLAEVTYKSWSELDYLLKELRQKFSGKINDQEVMLSSKALRVEHLVRDFYKELEINTIEQQLRGTDRVELDGTDKQILRQVSLDSESSILDIARKTGKTFDTVNSRLKKLVENKVIVKFFTEINLNQLGYTEYLYKIRLNNLDQDKISALTSDIKLNDNVKYAFLDITGTNILINFAFKEAKDVDEFTSELRKNYHSIIDTQDDYLIKEQLKFDLFPDAMLEK